MGEVWREPWFPWAAGIILGLPLAMLLLVELIVWLNRRGSPLAAPVAVLRNGFVPLLAAVLWLTRVAGWPRDDLAVKLLVTALWVVAIVAALSLFNAVFFAGAGRESWRGRLPRIFTDVARLLVIGAGLAVVLSTVWEFDVGGLVTAIGLTSLVIGLTLQQSVGGIITGLLLLFEQPFRLGDWLRVGSATGRVVQINWRAVHLDTGTALHILPNSSLAGAGFDNVSRNPDGHAATVALKFTLRDAPNAVRKLLVETAAALPGIAPAPPPTARVTAVEGDTITYTVTLPVPDIERTEEVRDAFFTRVWYAARRRGLALAGGAAYLAPDAQRVAAGLELAGPLLRLAEEERQALAPAVRVQRFAAGETALRRRQHPEGLRVILAGRARAVFHDPRAGELTALELGQGDYFGETVLTGEPSSVSFVVDEDLEVLLIPADEMHTLLATSPRLARDLGESMEQRRRGFRAVLEAAGLTLALPVALGVPSGAPAGGERPERQGASPNGARPA